MELTLVAVAGIVSIVVVAAFSRQIGVAAPLSQVVVGTALGFLPGVPHVVIEPELVLAGVLPPLLYAAAVRMPAHDFRRDFKSIAGLAVVLVVLTTVGAGFLFNAMLPGLGLAYAFALGAIISPTDAVAATSVGRRLGLPSRLLTILEGEGLVNDASSLVLLGSAISATTAAVSFWAIGLDFLYAVAAATVVGILIGQLNVRVRAGLKDSVLNTAISFVLPFVAYIPAEAIHASGVLAVVVTGVVTGHQSPRYVRAADRVTEAINWSTVSFLLESGLFLLMGLQLKTVLDGAHASGPSVATTIGIGLLAALLAIAARMLYVVPLVASQRRDASRAEAARPRVEAVQARLDEMIQNDELSEGQKRRFTVRFTQRKSDLRFKVAESFGWRGGVVLAWSGMRGAVTVAAAQTLPSGTPYRPQLQLIAFVVAITTLLLQGLTLPWVIRTTKVPGDDPAADRAEFGDLLTRLSSAALEHVDDPDLRMPDGTAYSPEILDRAREELSVRQTRPAAANLVGLREQYVQLRTEILRAERQELLEARTLGAYSSRVLNRAQEAIDTEEARVTRFVEEN
ncbi:MAG: sodium:proton antiporter [Hamadaea sp.]|uniref:cation:proton antiporter n=1 Tax=Hamadaea sp. TaxID=2024425 RepID=UPI0017D3F7E5|nr:sodium:proton antiporter [Hamadaea sp.]NUR69684.1 sodium:proton antiporter [Hamadaea sp.]NUT19551.1 sodium:proton antiporter [Hamadaea sp.]